MTILHTRLLSALVALFAVYPLITADVETSTIKVIDLSDLGCDAPQRHAAENSLNLPLFRNDGVDDFTWKMIGEVLKEPNNVVFSPISARIALTLLLEATGQNTNTQKELLTLLGDKKSIEQLRAHYKIFIDSSTEAHDSYTLSLGTKIFTDLFVEAKQKYAALVLNNYHADIERLNFAEAKEAANSINAWASNTTAGHLQNLVTADNVKNSVMLLANVIYFKGLWCFPFNNTYSGPFLKSPTDVVKVDYMDITAYFNLYKSPTFGARILRLPYKGQKFSLYVLLPDAGNDVNKILAKLEDERLQRKPWFRNEVKVRLTMPKFKFDFHKNLEEPLNNLGVHDIFTVSASLPGLARGAEVTGKLKVSKIFQMAGIEVNEKGTEAFAATVVEIVNKFGGNSIVEEFNVNQPFLFFIVDEVNDSILFAGKVLEPHL